MRLNRFLTSGTISLKHYLRAFYTLLPLSCFFKDNPVWDRLFVLSYPYFISPRFRERLSEKVKNTPTDENEAEVEADCLYNHFLNRKNQIVSPEQSNIKPMANR